MNMRPIAASFMLGILFCGSLSPAGDDPATTAPARDWFAMSPDQFDQTEEANRALPWGKPIDDNLMSAAVLHETNRYRAKNKLPALKHMKKVDEAAIMHAQDMSSGGWFSHVNEDDPKKREVIDRVKRLGLRPMFVGENILIEYGYKYEAGRKVFPANDGERISYEPDGKSIESHTYSSFAKHIVERWMNSPAHRENILSPHAKFLGAAVRAGKSENEVQYHKYYAVQVFFTPMPGR